MDWLRVGVFLGLGLLFVGGLIAMGRLVYRGWVRVKIHASRNLDVADSDALRTAIEAEERHKKNRDNRAIEQNAED